jgi:cobalamin biosynthesis Mg chelatase CobN
VKSSLFGLREYFGLIMTSECTSEYELIRQKNIVANEQFLKSLGLNTIQNDLNAFTSSIKASKRKASSMSKKQTTLHPLRKKSSRIEHQNANNNTTSTTTNNNNTTSTTTTTSSTTSSETSSSTTSSEKNNVQELIINNADPTIINAPNGIDCFNRKKFTISFQNLNSFVSQNYSNHGLCAMALNWCVSTINPFKRRNEINNILSDIIR